MTFLNDCDLDGIEASVVETLDATCVVRRPSRESDGMGGQTVTWTDSADIACRVLDAEYHYELTGDRLVRVTTVRIVLPKETDVTMGDVLDTGGVEWSVVGEPLRSYRSLVVSAESRWP